MTAESWRLLSFHRGSSELHFRLSDALVRKGAEPTVWWHAAGSRSLILGAAQALPATKEGRFGTTEPTYVRRTAGGTAVLADATVLGLDLFLPRSHPLSLSDVVESYRWVGETWQHALRYLGMEGHLVSIAEARADRPGQMSEAVRKACFGALSPYEVTVGGRKLVGLAQVRRAGGVLWQAGIHQTFDAETLARLLEPDYAAELAGELRRRAVGLSEIAEKAIAEEAVFQAFETALAEQHDVRLMHGEWRREELEYAEALEEASIIQVRG